MISESPISSNSSCSFDIIVSTCDEYSFLWQGFFYYLHKNWGLPNGRIIMTSTNMPKGVPGVECIGKASRRIDWSSRMLSALKLSQSEIVFVLLDDFYIVRPVDQNYVEAAYNAMVQDKTIMCVNLRDAEPESDYGLNPYNDFFVKKNNEATYCVTTQASFWRRDYLVKLLHPGENAWQFERFGSVRHRKYNRTMLYRKDACNDLFYYPRGGVMWNGAFHDTPEVKLAIQEAGVNASDETSKSAVRKEYEEKNNPFLRIYRKIYDRVSAFVSWLPYY